MRNDPIEHVMRQMLGRTLSGSGRYPPREREPARNRTWHDDYSHSWTGRDGMQAKEESK
jgi:hypothetical protein